MADPESQSCRVVVVASTTALAQDVAHRIKALSGDSSSSLNNESSTLSLNIPWRISNKYYTAEVHFRTVQLEYLEHEELDEVPALIYVWKGDESYKHEMKAISQHLTSTDFEVSLAISTQPSSHEDLEDQFFNHGLEYIDGSSPFTLSSSASESDGSIGEFVGTLLVVVLSSPTAPGMRRALDALSTIMWPSMARAGISRTSRTSRTVSSNAQHLDDPDLALQALIADSGDRSDEFATSRASRMQMEMDELEKWLQDDVTDDSKNDDPWKNKSSSPHAGRNGAKLESNHDVGFDDDFSDFVSGPSSSHPPDPNFTTAHPFSQLDDDESDDLPSRSEIKSAASRIFDADRNRELDEGVPSFDLSNILNALQGMKEEIAGIEDESKRRKAAAKVALGLVYGLEEFSGMDGDGPEPNPNARRAFA